MKKLNLAVVGSRDITDYVIFRRYALGAFYMLGFGIADIGKVTSGGADGADEIGMDFSIKNTIDFTMHIPEWKTKGVKDAFKRNGVIAQECDAAIVLWDASSRGTENTLDQLDDLCKPYILVFIDVMKNKKGKIVDAVPYNIQFKRPLAWRELYERTQQPDPPREEPVRKSSKRSPAVERDTKGSKGKRKSGTSVRSESRRGDSKRAFAKKASDRRGNGRGKKRL